MMDDWDQLTDLGDCGALLETWIPGVSVYRGIRRGDDIEWFIPARAIPHLVPADLIARLKAAS